MKYWFYLKTEHQTGKDKTFFYFTETMLMYANNSKLLTNKQTTYIKCEHLWFHAGSYLAPNDNPKSRMFPRSGFWYPLKANVTPSWKNRFFKIKKMYHFTKSYSRQDQTPSRYETPVESQVNTKTVHDDLSWPWGSQVIGNLIDSLTWKEFHVGI